MTEDASLDDFLDAGSEADDDGNGAVSAERGEPETGPGERDDAGLSTYDWSPDGAPCAACGDVVERRWRDDPGLVCESCKEW